MKKIDISISVTTLGLVLFLILCSFPLSFVFLQLYLFGLTACFIWMVLAILKDSDPSIHTFDERFYEDADLGPTSNNTHE